MSTDITTGDDVGLPVTLKKDGSVFLINAGATVKASLVDRDHTTILAGPVTLSNATPGSDWNNSLIMVEFTSAETGAIIAYNPSLLEIQVDDGGKLTWFLDVNIIKGTIA